MRKKIQKKVKSFLDVKDLYYSGFCLTDNYSFMFFDLDDDFIVENKLKISNDTFAFTENSLEVVFDKMKPLEYSYKGEKVFFKTRKDFIELEKLLFIKKKFPKCLFYEVTEFMGKEVNTLVIVLKEEYGKPFGILKTKIEGGKNGKEKSGKEKHEKRC